MDRSGIVVLAAGGSSRMGRVKQLLPYGGTTLVRHAVETALGAGCDRVIVVVGSHANEIRKALDGLAIEIVENARWQEGMGTSIQLGIAAAERQQLQGVILTLADLPRVTPETLQRLLFEHEKSGRPIIASEYAGTVGVPVFFAREFFPHLLALAPDQGCKGVILSNLRQVLRLDCPDAEFDIDRPEDYERISSDS